MFTPEEGELVLWRGSPTYSSRLLAFGFLGASLVGVGSYFVYFGMSDVGIAILGISVIPIVPTILIVLSVRGARYYITNMRVVRARGRIQFRTYMQIDVVRVDRSKFFGLSTLYFLLGDQRVMTSMVKKDGKYYFVRNYLSFSLLKDPKEPAKIARTAAEEYYRTIRSVNPVKQENSKEP